MSLAAAATSPVVLDLHDLPLLGLGTEEIKIPPIPTIGLEPSAPATNHPCVHIVGFDAIKTCIAGTRSKAVCSPGDIVVASGTAEHLMVWFPK